MPHVLRQRHEVLGARHGCKRLGALPSGCCWPLQLPHVSTLCTTSKHGSMTSAPVLTEDAEHAQPASLCCFNLRLRLENCTPWWHHCSRAKLRVFICRACCISCLLLMLVRLLCLCSYAKRQANLKWRHYVYRCLRGDYIAVILAMTSRPVKAGKR